MPSAKSGHGEILGHLSAASPMARNLESLELVDAKSLSNFLLNEHPQTIA